jgi:flavodoxin
MSTMMLPILAAAGGGPAAAAEKTLVAWFSRSGNTRVIGGQIARSLQADRFEIQPAVPYPDDYFENVAQAEREREAGTQPPLRASVQDMRSYERIYLGFPIWGMTAPAVIQTFLSTHDIAGKTIIPFVTHGGYGLGNSLEVVAEHARGARLLEGFTLERPQERQTIEQVNAWLETIR